MNDNRTILNEDIHVVIIKFKAILIKLAELEVGVTCKYVANAAVGRCK